jgi:dTMP kinase
MFITFEGVEGSGKTTHSKLLREFLVKQGHKVTLTREPGWGAVGKLIRRLLLEESEIELDSWAELCLFCADRAQHVKDLIKPKLKEGEIVICDRYTDSTMAYQGYGRRLNLDLVEKIVKASSLGLRPELTLLLNLPVKLGLSRIEDRAEKSKFDEESVQFHERVRQGFMYIAKKEPERVKVISAAKDVKEVQEEIRNTVLECLSE